MVLVVLVVPVAPMVLMVLVVSVVLVVLVILMVLVVLVVPVVPVTLVVLMVLLVLVVLMVLVVLVVPVVLVVLMVINGDELSCVDKNNYNTRCKCYKMKMACTKACNCKNCANTFGRRTLQESHVYQIPMPNSKKFAEESLENIMQGPWTSLENAIFIFIIEDFKSFSEEITVENMLKPFNELVTIYTVMWIFQIASQNLLKSH